MTEVASAGSVAGCRVLGIGAGSGELDDKATIGCAREVGIGIGSVEIGNNDQHAGERFVTGVDLSILVCVTKDVTGSSPLGAQSTREGSCY